MAQQLDSAERRSRFDELYRTHYAAIYAYAHRRQFPGGFDASDLVADVFAVAWRRIGDVPATPEDRLWLYGVARHRVMRSQRAGIRRLRLHTRLIDQATHATQESSDTAKRLRDAIAGLRTADREVLMLVMWDGLSHAEAATVMGCSVNAVALRLRRAKERLRDELRPPGSFPSRAISEQEAQN